MTVVLVLAGYLLAGTVLFWALLRLVGYVDNPSRTPLEEDGDEDGFFLMFLIGWPVLTPIILSATLSASDISLGSSVVRLYDRIFQSIKNLLT